jgi:UDP-N-acetylglucosamine 1-carboxyvinyltransferase
MTTLEIDGGLPLNGAVVPSGNVNAAIPLIVASALTQENSTLANIPATTGVEIIVNIGRQFGLNPEAFQDGTLTLRTSELVGDHIPKEAMLKSRASILFVGPLLARRGSLSMYVGENLSSIRTHLTALKDLGILRRMDKESVYLELSSWDIQDVMLMEASVTATELLLMIAAANDGITILRNAASEPHIQDLCKYLSLMGAEITGIGTNVLVIRGGKYLRGVRYEISPDHIEVASLAALAALTHGSIKIHGVQPEHLRLILKVYETLGIRTEIDGTTLTVPIHERLTITDELRGEQLKVETGPWPSFPADLVALAVVIATQTAGNTLIHDKMYDNRLYLVDKLTFMGGQLVLCDPHRVVVIGPTQLIADDIDSVDVRAGWALLGAALCANGTSTIGKADELSRTFAGYTEKLRMLGARIRVRS